jgi:hypothetical protein
VLVATKSPWPRQVLRTALPKNIRIRADEKRDLSRAFAVFIMTGIARLFGQGSLSVAIPTLPVTCSPPSAQ